MGNCCVSKDNESIEEGTAVFAHPNDNSNAPGEKLSLVQNDMNAVAATYAKPINVVDVTEAPSSPSEGGESFASKLPPAGDVLLARKHKFNQVGDLQATILQ